jgi:hypothetical protein
MANNLLASLEGHWTMNEATNRLDDVNGNTASPGTSPNVVAGLLGNAAENPSAGNRHLVIANDPALVFSGAESFSLAAWVRKYTSTDTSGQIIGLWEANPSYSLAYNKAVDAMQFELSPDGTYPSRVPLVSSVTMTDDVWYHVIAVHDADADLMKIYVTPVTDSVPAVPDTLAHTTGVYENNAEAIRMFLLPAVGEFPGRIDEVAVWRRVLTAADITTHFNGGSPFPYNEWQSVAEIASDNDAGLPLHQLKARKKKKKHG